MKTTSADFPTTSDALQARLEETFADSSPRYVAAATAQADDIACAAVEGHQRSSAPHDFMIEIGCVTKILTATLTMIAIDQGALALDDHVAPLVDDRRRRSALRGVMVRHLLEHTHGLADLGVAEAPINRSGRFAAEKLRSAIVRCQHFGAGELYSYSDVGFWLLAAILERVWDMSYEEAVWSKMLGPIGIIRASTSPCGSTPRICPSRGGVFALSIGDILRVLRSTISRLDIWPSSFTEAQVIKPLPGWNATERGIYLGWKYFGDGWYGHNSQRLSTSLLVRIRPASSVAAVVASRDQRATFLAAKVFGADLPEFRNMTIPKPLSPADAGRINFSSYCGRYGRGVQRMAIALANGKLTLSCDNTSVSLSPAANEMFFLRPAIDGRPPFVQLLGPSERRFRYLWDGQQIFANLARCRSPGPSDATHR